MSKLSPLVGDLEQDNVAPPRRMRLQGERKGTVVRGRKKDQSAQGVQQPYGQPPQDQSAYGQPPQGQEPYGAPQNGQQPYAYAPPAGATTATKRKKPWYKRIWVWLVGLLAIIVIGSALGQGGSDKSASSASTSSTSTSETSTPTSDTTTGTTEATDATDATTEATDTTTDATTEATDTATDATDTGGANLTPQQELAVESAKSYLEFKGFSRQGLIDQLSSEYGDQYSVADATAAVDSLNEDWNAQAVKAANDYLDFKAFSCNGLIEQLASQYGDQFTQAQATYGAKHTKACGG